MPLTYLNTSLLGQRWVYPLVLSLGMASSCQSDSQRAPRRESAGSAPVSRPVFDFPIRRVVSVEVAGDPSVGTIRHLRMIHHTSAVEAMRARTDLTEADRLDLDRERFSRCLNQFSILQELETAGARHIFFEGWAEGATVDREGWLSDPSIRGARDVFRTVPRDHRDLNEAQIESLFNVSSFAVYMLRHPGARVHWTESLSLNQEMHRIQRRLRESQGGSSLDITPTPDFIRIHNQREDFALERALEFLDSHPGETVFLLYGGAHAFGPNLSHLRPHPPRLESVDWILPDFLERGSPLIPEPVVAE